MKNHAEQDQVALYLDEQLPDDQVRSFEHHLKSCAACGEEVASQKDLKSRLARIPTRRVPPELLSQLKQRYIGPSVWDLIFSGPLFRRSWKPIGAVSLATAALMLWLINQASARRDYIDLEPILARHARYRAESLVPPADMVASNFSAHLASYRRYDYE